MTIKLNFNFENKTLNIYILNKKYKNIKIEKNRKTEIMFELLIFIPLNIIV